MHDESTIVSLADLEYDSFKDSNHVFTDKDVHNAAHDTRTEGTIPVNQQSI